MVSIKLGNSLFNQEKRINEYKEENERLTKELNNLLKETQNLRASDQEVQKNMIELKNSNKIKDIELELLNTKYKKLYEEYQLISDQNIDLISKDNDKTQRILSLNKQIDSLNQEILRTQNDELRLKSEISRLEKIVSQTELEKQELKHTISEKLQSIGTLEKSIGHKDKYLAILMKEKDRLIKPDSLKEQEKNIPNQKQKLNYLSLKSSEKSHFSSEDDIIMKSKISILGQQLEERQECVTRLEKENFQLMARLRNIKCK